MRAITFVVRPTERSHPMYRLFESEPELSRDRIYQSNVLEDGTVVLLGRLRGDVERARALVEAQPYILAASVSRVGEDEGLAYVHAESPPEIRQLLELPREHEVVFDFPLEWTQSGGFRIVMVGETDAAVRGALSAIPPSIEVTVERVGPYPAQPARLRALLTSRQLEVLEVAVDLGYYRVPREATHRDVAERMGLSVGTVSEHLQKVEARVFEAFIDGGELGADG